MSVLALSPEADVLFVGINAHRGLLDLGSNRRFLAPHSVSPNNPTPGAIIAINTHTGRLCETQPIWLDQAPGGIAIAQDRTLFAELPDRLFFADTRAIACK